MLPTVTSDRNRFAQQLFTPLPQRYDRLAEVLSLGQNGRWRRAMIDRIVANVAPHGVRRGLGNRRRCLATGPSGRPPKFVGVDLTRSMLARGSENVPRPESDRRMQLVAGGPSSLPFPDGTSTALTFTYLLRYVEDPPATLIELARVVKPGGAVASLEFLVPPSSFWRFWWWGTPGSCCPLGGWLTGGRAGSGWGASSAPTSRGTIGRTRVVDGRRVA